MLGFESLVLWLLAPRITLNLMEEELWLLFLTLE